ncbi:MAG: pyridoxal 5'-phosphate synthase glutaminase subunit PdxT [Eubacterium sp.]|nr:pyridoxal 5'-phosphate synthase glutaminase subunit PdxT [Eubacterium sp.]
MTIGILAVQGAFIEHAKVLEKLGVSSIELRKASDLENHIDGLILPGGESTVQGKLLRELGMYDILKEKIENGLPVLATCAGMILLASQIDNDTTSHFGTIPMTVKRNAYGRQLGSFHTTGTVKNIGEVPMTFIRAPYVSDTTDAVETLAVVDGKTVGVKYKNQMAFAFHPELDDDLQIHKAFIELIKK